MVVVLNAEDANCRHSVPRQGAIVISGRWLLSRLEDEPIGTIQIDSKLAFSVTGEFVTSAGQRSHRAEGRSRSQIVEPAS
jgi:hypothetical protein